MKKLENKIKDLLDKISDLSFGEIITLKALKFMYWVEIALGGILAAITVVLGFQQSTILGIIAATVSPILLFIYVVIVKIIFEVISVVFQISSMINKITDISPEDFIEEDKRIEIDDYEVEDREEDNNKNENT